MIEECQLQWSEAEHIIEAFGTQSTQVVAQNKKDESIFLIGEIGLLYVLLNIITFWIQ